MANRVTGTEVKTIFETDMIESELTPFITSVNTFINATTDLLTLSDALLKEIEMWLSAHFASAKDQRITYQSFGDSKAKFQGEYTYGLNATDYGQRAIMLDTTGTLADIASNLQTASIVAYPVDYPTTYATGNE